MKQKQVRDALYEAFYDYWNTNNEIKIDGNSTTKVTRTEYLTFDEECIVQLTHTIGCQEENPKLTGTLTAYILAATQGNNKSIKLNFTIRNSDYSALYQREEDVVKIVIQNIEFHKSLI